MWRIEHDNAERGVIAPLTAIVMVAVLGMAAFAVDVATMYSEHAQLQNGADSAALSIAQACAATPPTLASIAACAVPKDDAASLAKGNALDGSSHVLEATVNGGTVDVTTQTEDAAGNKHFSLVFARILGIDTADIRAAAQAQFGGYSAADVVPLTFSQCEADPTFVEGVQFFPTHGSKISDKAPYNCPHQSSSGHELPGGFGWLLDPNANCSVRVDVNNPWVEAKPGNSPDGSCADMLNAWGTRLASGNTVEILIPIFDTACPDKGGTGSDPCTDSPYGKSFHIEAFAQISLRGWNLSGSNTLPWYYMTPDAKAIEKDLKLGGSDRGIFGEFIQKVTLAEAAVLGGPTTYGATGVHLTK